MNKTGKRLMGLAAGCASLFALAAQDVTPLTQATGVLNDCAAVANSISAVPVPADHAKAAMASATNDTITDPTQKLAIDPTQTAFAQQMKDGAARLDACGKNVRAATGQANDFIRGLGSQTNMSQDDANAVKAAYAAFAQAQENMRAATAMLTSDQVRASYMMAPLQANFLQPATPNSGTAPRRAQQ